MNPMWTLEEALTLVRALQFKVRQYNYHLAIGGGVINNGQSDKDLDLYFLSLNNTTTDTNPAGLRAFLRRQWGEEFNLGGAAQGGVRAEDVDRAYAPEPVWGGGRYTYRPDNRRIDVFISE